MSPRSRRSSFWGKFPLLATIIALLASSLFAADQPAPAQRAKAATDFLRLPLAFEQNQGQAPPSTLFISRGRGYMLALERDRALLALKANKGEAAVLGFALVNGSPSAKAQPEQQLPGRANYLVGDESDWRTNIPLFGRVRYRGVYKGVELVYYGNQRQLEYDFRVAPGADAQQIAFNVEGADKLSIGANGDLVITIAGHEVRWHKPLAYQIEANAKHEIASAYQLSGKRVSFDLGPFDHSRELVIDPTLAYSTYLGGSNDDVVNAIAVDTAGNAYVTGQTWGSGFPVGPGYKTSNGSNEIAFVTKLNASGSALVYSTFLGGHVNTGGTGIAVDGSGYAYVGGSTVSPDFPVKNYAQRFLNGGMAFRSTNAASSWSGTNKGLQQDLVANAVIPAPNNTETIFVGAKPAWTGGNTLLKSTDGGLSFSPSQSGLPSSTQVNALAFSPGSSSTMFAGTTAGLYRSTDGGTTWTCALCSTQTNYNISYIAFAVGNPNLMMVTTSDEILRSNDGGKTFTSQWFLGSGAVITGISFANATTAYVSLDEPQYANSGSVYKTSDGGASFQNLQSFGWNTAAHSVLALPGTNTVLVGGNAGILRSDDGGNTWSVESGSPTWVGSFAGAGSTIYAGSMGDGVFKSSDGGTTWTAMDSGLRNVQVRSIAISPQNSAYLYAGSDADHSDGFVAKLSQDGTSLVFSTYLGGASVSSLAQSAGNAYVTGVTSSPNYPVTSGAFQTTNNSTAANCPYVVIGHCGTGVVVKLSTSGSSFTYATYLGGSSQTQPNAIAVGPDGSAVVTGNTVANDFPMKNAAQPVCAGTSCADAFVASLNSTGSALNYSTYWGGSDSDVANGVAVDGSGNVYVVGMTGSSNFRTTAGALQMMKPGQGPAAFVTSFSPAGAVRYSTYYGGTGSTYYDDTGGVSQLGDAANAVAVDGSGNAVFTGSTTSPDLPVKDAVAQYEGGDCMAGHASIPCGDAFISKLDSTGSSLLFGTWLGGDGVDSGHGVALDASNNIYVGGLAGSDNFPTTSGAFQTTGHISDAYDYQQDGFVAKISLGGSSGGGAGTCTAPTSAGVNICSPADGSTVSSPVQITAAATGVNGPVQTMKIYVDGTSVFTGSGSSLSTSLAMSNGAHKITVKGWDSTSTSVSKSINITVGTTTSGGGGTGGTCTAPSSAPNNTVTICSPANASTVSSPVRVTAAAKSTSTVTAMKIYLDGTSVYSTSSSTIDTSLTMSAGSHHITVKAWVGSTSFSSAVSFTVQ